MNWSSFHIMRHGVTDANEAGWLQGQAESPATMLNAAGRAQALAIVPTLQRVGFDGIVTSPLARAQETANIIGDSMQLPVVVEDDLKEKHFGPLEGMTDAEADAWRTANPHLMGDIEPELGRPHVQGAETYGDFRARGLRVMREFLQNHADQKWLFVTHGAFIRMLCRNFCIARLDKETPNARPFHFQHTPPDSWQVLTL